MRTRSPFGVFLLVFLFTIGFSAWVDAGPGPIQPGATLAQVRAVTSFTFQPGGTASLAAGRYVTWASLYAAASQVQMPIIVVDSTYEDTPTVPAGSYAVSNWTFTTSTYATLLFADGAVCTLTNNLWIDGGINFQTAATSAPTFVLSASAYANVFIVHDSFISNTADATQPFFQQATGGGATFWITSTSFLGYYGNGPGTMVDVASGGNAYLLFDSSSSLLPSTLSGAGTIKVYWDPSLQSNSISSTQSATGITWHSGPATTASFGASATLTGTAAVQNIPPAGTVTVLQSADNLGVMVGSPGTVARLYVSYTGSSSNTTQTAAIACYMGGAAMTGFTVSGLPTNCTPTCAHTSTVTPTTPVFYPAGSIFNCRLTTGSLSVALVDINVALGGNAP